MCLQITNYQWVAYDAFSFSLESAGALAFTNECSGSAVLSARYIAFAERQLGLSRPTRSAALEVMMTRLPTQEFVAFVGIDWADTSHAVCLQAAGSDIRESSVLAHTPEAISTWACMLRHRFSGRPIAVCLELTKGPLVSALRAHDFLVLFSVNAHTNVWIRHLRLCEVPSCGRLFWAPHSHNRYCEEHPRGAVWAEKSRKSQT
jgi:hypothetical protein